MKKTLVLSTAIVTAAAIGAGTWWNMQSRQEAAKPPEPVQLHPNEPGVLRFPAGSSQLTMLSVALMPSMPMPLAEPLNARVAFDESHTARVSSPIAGRIVELRAQLGDAVKAGAPLALIDAPDLGAAQADLAKARADEQRKGQALGRARELFAGEVLPKKDLESTEADHAQAKAEAERAALRLASLSPQRAQLAGQRMLLAAPVAGVVVDRKANPGMQVRPDLPDPLFVVTDLKRVQVVIDLPEQLLSKVAIGQLVSVEVDAWQEERFAGKVERIAPVVDPVTRRVQVRCSVDNSAQKLRPEMYARVVLISDEHHAAIRVPNSSLVTEGLYSFVFVEREAGVFEKRKVEMAVQDREYSYVSSGIKPEDKVVFRGALLLASELASGS